MTVLTNSETSRFNGITGKPLTSKRAKKLAKVIAVEIDRWLDSDHKAEVMTALFELLIGISPETVIKEKFRKIETSRNFAFNSGNPKPEFPAELVNELTTDLWLRRIAFLEAIGTLYSFTDEFAEALEMHLKEIKQRNTKAKTKKKP